MPRSCAGGVSQRAVPAAGVRAHAPAPARTESLRIHGHRTPVRCSSPTLHTIVSMNHGTHGIHGSHGGHGPWWGAIRVTSVYTRLDTRFDRAENGKIKVTCGRRFWRENRVGSFTARFRLLVNMNQHGTR